MRTRLGVGMRMRVGMMEEVRVARVGRHGRGAKQRVWCDMVWDKTGPTCLLLVTSRMPLLRAVKASRK